MNSIGPYLVGAAFWIFIGACAVAGIVADYKRRRFAVDVLRMAIEKGQPLEPALVEKLIAPGPRAQPIDPELLNLGGIITVASGAGICVLSFFVSRVAPVALCPLLGAGALAVCVGVGLLVGSKAVARARERDSMRNDST
jgi:hypothetical protein